MAGLAKAQRAAAGLDVRVLATHGPHPARDVADDLNAAGVPAAVVSRGELKRAMSQAVGSADVIHAHGVWAAEQHLAAVAARRLGKPYVITPHGMLTTWSLAQKRLKKQIYLALRLRRDLNAAAAVHCTSTVEREAMAPLSLRPKVIVEPLGIDQGEFADLPPRGSFRRRFPQLGDDRIILFLGRIHRGKGLEYLVPALAEAKLQNVKLVIVGPDSGGFKTTIDQLIDRHNLRDRVLFTGMLRGRERLEGLVDADLFALPSEHENFGVVVVEALACGTPVLISDGVAIYDQITTAKVGGVVRARDIPALSRELKRWMEDDELRRAAAARARPFAAEAFDWSAIARRWAGHYENLIGGR
jgi:glycosyltransferase involved in cell wall biosynthesis